jgi:hypothetical protein
MKTLHKYMLHINIFQILLAPFLFFLTIDVNIRVRGTIFVILTVLYSTYLAAKFYSNNSDSVSFIQSFLIPFTMVMVCLIPLTFLIMYGFMFAFLQLVIAFPLLLIINSIIYLIKYSRTSRDDSLINNEDYVGNKWNIVIIILGSVVFLTTLIIYSILFERSLVVYKSCCKEIGGTLFYIKNISLISSILIAYGIARYSNFKGSLKTLFVLFLGILIFFLYLLLVKLITIKNFSIL